MISPLVDHHHHLELTISNWFSHLNLIRSAASPGRVWSLSVRHDLPRELQRVQAGSKPVGRCGRCRVNALEKKLRVQKHQEMLENAWETYQGNGFECLGCWEWDKQLNNDADRRNFISDQRWWVTFGSSWWVDCWSSMRQVMAWEEPWIAGRTASE